MSDYTIVPIKVGLATGYILAGERAVIVDTGYPKSEGPYLEALASRGLSDRVSLILITHGHQDHFGSAAVLKERTGAPVAVHRADADWLAQGVNPPVKPTSLSASLMRLAITTLTKPVLTPVQPDIILGDEGPAGFDLSPFGPAGRVIPTPGHTPGSVSVVLESGPALVGDLVFGRLTSPRRPCRPWFAEDLDLWQESLKTLLAQKPSLIHLAHGGPFRPEEAARLV